MAGGGGKWGGEKGERIKTKTNKQTKNPLRTGAVKSCRPHQKQEEIIHF